MTPSYTELPQIASFLERDPETLGHPIERAAVDAEDLDGARAVLIAVSAKIDGRAEVAALDAGADD